jgi:predicted nuclease with TOPRIM domain
MELLKRLDGFELKLRQLASKFGRQQEEKSLLAKENKRLKQELDRQHGVVASLREKLEQTAATVRPLEGETTAGAGISQEKIEACIRELDFCIEWLEKH